MAPYNCTYKIGLKLYETGYRFEKSPYISYECIEPLGFFGAFEFVKIPLPKKKLRRFTIIDWLF